MEYFGVSNRLFIISRLFHFGVTVEFPYTTLDRENFSPVGRLLAMSRGVNGTQDSHSPPTEIVSPGGRNALCPYTYASYFACNDVVPPEWVPIHRAHRRFTGHTRHQPKEKLINTRSRGIPNTVSL